MQKFCKLEHVIQIHGNAVIISVGFEIITSSGAG